MSFESHSPKVTGRHMAMKYDWDLDAYFSQKEMAQIPPHENVLASILGEPAPLADHVAAACRCFHAELGECLRRATDLRRDLEDASGLVKKAVRQICRNSSDYSWIRFTEEYRAVVPDAYFRALAPAINSLMNILKDKRRLRVRKKAAAKT